MASHPNRNKSERFINAVKRIEQKATVSAAIIINPKAVDQYGTQFGRVMISYPRDGAGRLHVVAWLPGKDENGDRFRHYGWANGYGYDKATAALAGAVFTKPDGTPGKIEDSGYDWRHQLEAAGFIVAQAC